MTGEGSQGTDGLKLLPKEWLRELVTRGLGQMRLRGGRAVITHLQGCHAEEGADRGFWELWDAGWKILGVRFPAAAQGLSYRPPDATQMLRCVREWVLCVCLCTSVCGCMWLCECEVHEVCVHVCL